jgi:phospholipid/cholesterol/gamma-HCH transport system substrate-binding protein
METKANYTLIGVFVMGLIIAGVLIILWLSTNFNEASYKTYQVLITESVSGLNKQSPVKYNGVEVGFVKDIHLNYQDLSQVLITVAINNTVPITTSTRAVLMQQGITGLAYLGLQGGGNAPLLKAAPGQIYPLIYSSPSLYLRIEETVKKVSASLQGFSNSVQILLNPDNQQAVKEILATLNHDLPKVFNTVNVTAKKFGNASQSITHHAVPSFTDTMQSINAVSNQLKPFVQELKQDPSMIISGGAQPKPGPGEK